jgi:hypothetical protein
VGVVTLSRCIFAQLSLVIDKGTMTDPQLIAPVSGSTPADPDISRRAPSLPYDLLKEASRRLEIMSLIAASLWVLGTIGDRIALLAMTHGDRAWLRPQATDVIAGISVLASLALFFYIHRGDRDPQFILDLGQVYMVLMAFALGLHIHFKSSGYPKIWLIERPSTSSTSRVHSLNRDPRTWCFKYASASSREEIANLVAI